MVRAVFDYEEYVKIAEQLNLPLVAAVLVKEQNHLDWFELTESAHSILHGLIALADSEEMNERNKPNPDQQRIDELKAWETR